jgi:hypothetical protein
METYGVPPTNLASNRLTLIASRVFVLVYDWAIASAITALALSRWNDHERVIAIFGCVLALVFGALGSGAVLRPMRVGFLHLTSLLGLGAFSLIAVFMTFETAWFWLSIGALLGSVVSLALLDRVIWEDGRCKLRVASEDRGPN